MPREVDQGTTSSQPQELPGQLSALLRELACDSGVERGADWDRELRAGAVIGRFELVREIGRGGFGVVYEARDLELGRAVAFKAVKAGSRLALLEDGLLREAEAVARLAHPNIVTLFDVGKGDHGPYLVFELLRGMTLAQRLEQGQMEAAEAVRIALEVAKGVAHAHASGVVHRDLKPGNVFLCQDGQVKVLDLGMAHAFGRRGVSGGTPGYMAPEQREGAAEDERTDVFAMGVLLHRMLTNELPPSDTASTTSPHPALDVPGGPGLGELISRMLERDAMKRPRDAGEALAALKSIQADLERTLSTKGSVQAKTRRRLHLAAGMALGAAIAIAGAGFAASWTAKRDAVAATTPSIAVLPFADLSPDKDQEYLSDGLADEILNTLARVHGLRVPSRTSSFYFKGKHVKLEDIGKELNVAAVLEGSVRKSGNRVRVAAQVVNIADGDRLWGQTYDRELTNIFAVQDEITAAVVGALDAKLLARSVPSSRAHTTNLDAYGEYLLGQQQYHRSTAESCRLATQAYERAVALDPNYAPAWAGLGLALFSESELAGNAESVATLHKRALSAAEKAGALAPDVAEALSARGILRALLEYDWPRAQADLERAVAVNPNDADAHRRYGLLLENLGRLPEAVTEVRKAVELDPLGPSWARLGCLYQATGDLDRADAAFQRHLHISPDAVPALWNLARNLLLQSKPKEALTLFERCPEEKDHLWGTAMAERALGHPQPSQAALDALVSRYAGREAFDIAEIYASRGDKDAAFRWLERAIEQPGTGMSGVFRMDPFLRDLRGDPRYTALLRKMKLPVVETASESGPKAPDAK